MKMWRMELIDGKEAFPQVTTTVATRSHRCVKGPMRVQTHGALLFTISRFSGSGLEIHHDLRDRACETERRCIDFVHGRSCIHANVKSSAEA